MTGNLNQSKWRHLSKNFHFLKKEFTLFSDRYISNYYRFEKQWCRIIFIDCCTIYKAKMDILGFQIKNLKCKDF